MIPTRLSALARYVCPSLWLKKDFSVADFTWEEKARIASIFRGWAALYEEELLVIGDEEVCGVGGALRHEWA